MQYLVMTDSEFKDLCQIVEDWTDYDPDTDYEVYERVKNMLNDFKKTDLEKAEE